MTQVSEKMPSDLLFYSSMTLVTVSSLPLNALNRGVYECGVGMSRLRNVTVPAMTCAEVILSRAKASISLLWL